MGISHEHVGPKISAKIKIYILTRAELLCSLCYEIPCSSFQNNNVQWKNSNMYCLLFIFIYIQPGILDTIDLKAGAQCLLVTEIKQRCYPYYNFFESGNTAKLRTNEEHHCPYLTEDVHHLNTQVLFSCLYQGAPFNMFTFWY